MDFLTTKFEVKAAEGGGVRGYASIFGNVDLGGDVVMPNAFREIDVNSEGKVLMMFGHGVTEKLPIGKALVRQDTRGLAFDAELIMDDPFVQRVHTHLKARTLEKMSIGYDVLPGGSEMRDGKRLLTGLKLWEISVVPWAMNPLATISAVKSRAELEDRARDLLGLSKSKARRLAHAGWPVINGDDPDDEIAPDLKRELSRILNTTLQLKGN